MDAKQGMVGLGHEAMGYRPNVRKELMRLRRDPLERLLKSLGDNTSRFPSNELTLYEDSYRFYYLSLQRMLWNTSVSGRYMNGLYFVRRSSGKYSAGQRRLASQYNRIAPFLEYDLANCLIHTRILLDRVTGLSRHFLTGKSLPSFTSFNKHKAFFEKLTVPFGRYEAYAQYIRAETSWFEMPLKAVRDKFVVHAAPKHWRFIAHPSPSVFELAWLILPLNDSGKMSPENMITVNPLRLSYDIEKFLTWFCAYGLSMLDCSA